MDILPTQLYRRRMATVDVHLPHEDDFVGCRDAWVEAVRSSDWTPPIPDLIVEMSEATTSDWFNFLLEELYDQADRERVRITVA